MAVQKNKFLSTLSNLCFFQTGVKISFDQPLDEDQTLESVRHFRIFYYLKLLLFRTSFRLFQSPKNLNGKDLGTISCIESEETFTNLDPILEDTIEDALVFYVTKGKMVVEHAPQDYLIDVTDDNNSLFKVRQMCFLKKLIFLSKRLFYNFQNFFLFFPRFNSPLILMELRLPNSKKSYNCQNTRKLSKKENYQSKQFESLCMQTQFVTNNNDLILSVSM